MSFDCDYVTDEKLWQSYVYHNGKCWFVSTIVRNYETYVGVTRGCETLVWEYDDSERKRGKMVGHMGGVADHQAICRCLIATGEILDVNNEGHRRFFEKG
jgi:hypothetical protein